MENLRRTIVVLNRKITFEKVLRIIGPKIIYFVLAFICFQYVNYLLYIAGDLIKGVLLLLLISFLQIPLPEIETHVSSATTAVMNIFTALFSIIKTLTAVTISLLGLSLGKRDYQEDDGSKEK